MKSKGRARRVTSSAVGVLRNGVRDCTHDSPSPRIEPPMADRASPTQQDPSPGVSMIPVAWIKPAPDAQAYRLRDASGEIIFEGWAPRAHADSLTEATMWSYLEARVPVTASRPRLLLLK